MQKIIWFTTNFLSIYFVDCGTINREQHEISSNKNPQKACKHLTKPIQLFVLLSHAAVGNEAETER